jgi:Mu transposase-like protein
LPLPDVPAATDLVQPAHVDKTAFVRFDTNVYSVPHSYAQQTLTLAADDSTVRILEGGHVVAQHPRCWGQRQMLEAKEHRESLLAHKRQARQAKGQDRLRLAVPEIDALFARWVDAGRNVGNLTAQVLRLLDLYGEATLAAAVTEVLSRGTHDPGAVAVVCEHLRRKGQKPLPVEVHLGPNVPERDVIPHSLENYDAKPQRRD